MACSIGAYEYVDLRWLRLCTSKYTVEQKGFTVGAKDLLPLIQSRWPGIQSRLRRHLFTVNPLLTPAPPLNMPLPQISPSFWGEES